jgi:formylglycine-generating enzyme required for sulfatase activity
MRLFPVLAAASLVILAAGPAPSAGARDRAARPFRDCRGCPEMVAVPAGRFMMGATADDPGRDAAGREEPRHEVVIAHPFAVGRFEVLRGEWAEFVRATGLGDPEGCNIHQATVPRWPTVKGLNWHDPGFAQSDRDPAVCMSWNEARAYVAWLSRKTGRHYRLLSEAEWEYAARAGTTSPHFWGERPEDACLYANGSDMTRKQSHPEWNADQPCRDGFVDTSPAGSFRPNAFGLYDMLGNVAEMTEDCRSDDYAGAPADGSPREDGNCRYRINRGDTWTSTPGDLRSAARGYDDAALTRVVDLGFRVARDM